jgi:hypothetical protein
VLRPASAAWRKSAALLLVLGGGLCIEWARAMLLDQQADTGKRI